MKLIFLFFFYSALCTIQTGSLDKALSPISHNISSISQEEFTRIGEFISRVEKAKSGDLVTKQDSEMLLQLGFEPLFFLSSPSKWKRSALEEDSEATWDKINDFCTFSATEYDDVKGITQINPHQILFAEVLKLFYCFESVDSLSREEFFDFYRLVDFLQGGRQHSLIGRMQSLNNALAENISNCDLQYFGNQEGEIVEIVCAIFTPASLSLNFDALRLRFGFDIYSTVENVLQHLTTNPASLSKLEKVEILYFGYSTKMEAILFEILQRNSNSITCLSIQDSKFQWKSDKMIRFPDLSQVSLGRCGNFKFLFEFLLHSNYTVLEIDHLVSITRPAGQNSYFEVSESCDTTNDYLSIIMENKNLKSLVIPETLTIDCELKSALDSLKNLESLKLSSRTINPKGFFPTNNTLYSLQIRNNQHFDWQSLAQELPHLKHLEIKDYNFTCHNQFLQFLSTSKLESIYMCFFQRSEPEDKTNLISAFNDLSTLKKLELRFLHACKLPLFGFNPRFQALNYEGILASSAGESKFLDLPSGPGVKYLKIRHIHPSSIPFTSLDAQMLKEKFPKLQLLVLPRGLNVQALSERVECEIRTYEEDLDFFNSVPSLTLR